MSTTGAYIIDSGLDGKKRLNILSEVLHSSTVALLKSNGLSEGMSFLDAGCGGGNVSRIAAGIVGPTGTVTAVDFDPEIIALNQKEQTENNTTNINYLVSDIYNLPFNNQFDIAYARFLLSHLKDPELALSGMMKSVKPGGRVIVADVHFSGHFCYPENAAFYQYVDLYTTAGEHRGQHPEIGPALPQMFRKCGMKGISFDVIQPTFETGAGKWMAWLTMDRIKDSLIADGITDAKTINRILSELEAFTKNNGTIISLPRIFMVTGTCP